MIKEHCASSVHAFLAKELLVLGAVCPFYSPEGAVLVDDCTCREGVATAPGDLRSNGVGL